MEPAPVTLHLTRHGKTRRPIRQGVCRAGVRILLSLRRTARRWLKTGTRAKKAGNYLDAVYAATAAEQRKRQMIPEAINGQPRYPHRRT